MQAEEQREAKQKQVEQFRQYSENSLAFIENILGENLPACLCPIFESWDQRQITVLVSATGVGKTYSLARLALFSYVCQTAPKIFMAAAPPEDNLKLMLWNELLAASYKRPDLLKNDKITDLMVAPSGEEGEEDKTSRLIKGLIIPATGDPHQREAKFSGKHSPYLAFILDEGDAIPPEVYKGIDGCLSGGKTRLVIAFNPRKQSGPVWDLIKSGRAHTIEISAFDHPNVITGEDVIPGAVTRERTIQRISEWTRPLIAGEQIDQECYQVHDYLIGKSARRENGEGWYEPLAAGWRKIEDQQFYYKVLAKFPTQSESGLIPKLWFDRAIENGKRYVSQHGDVPPDGIMPKLGDDIAESLAGDENVLSARWDFLLNVGFDRWRGMDTITGTERMERRYRELNASEILVDATSVGAGTAPTLRRKKLNVSAVKVASRPTRTPGVQHEAKFHRMREQLMWSLREWFSRPDAALIPYSVKLEEQFLFWEYCIEGGEIKCSTKDKFRDVFGYSPDDFDSAILTFGDSERKFFGAAFDSDVNVVDIAPNLSPAWKYFTAFRYSTRLPCCYLVMAVDFEQRLHLIAEHYEAFYSIETTVEAIKAIEKKLPRNSPRDTVPQLRLAGAELWAKENKDGAHTDDSIASVFSRHGIYFTQASDDSVSGWAATRDVMATGKLKIVRPECPNTVRTIPEIDYEPSGSGQRRSGYENIDESGETSAAHALRMLVLHAYKPTAPTPKPTGWRAELKPQRRGGGIKFHNG